MKKILLSIKKRPLNPVLIGTMAVLYLLNNLWFKRSMTEEVRWFFTGYFNDLICPLIFFSYVNILLLTADREMTGFLPLTASAAGAGLFWEFVAPLIKPGSVPDPADMLCYLAGGVGYWFLLRLCLRKERRR